MPAVAAPLFFAERYLAAEPCYRVELVRHVGQTPRVSYVECTDVLDAIEYADTLAKSRPGNAVLSVRRATVADAEEFAEFA